MFELAAADFARIWPLAEASNVGRTFIAALLEGNHTGRVFVDSREAPSAALVALTCEFLYPLGSTDHPQVRDAVRELIFGELTLRQDYAVVFPTSGPWAEVLEAMLGSAPELHHAARDEYTFDHEQYRSAHGGWRDSIPAGFEVRAYDQGLAEGQGFTEFWGSIEAFLERGIGFAVVKDGEAVSRCHTVMVGAGEAEISIETTESYRRQGLATLAACAFIESCLAVGLEPAWSNWDYNAPSRSLATRLGFVGRDSTPALIAKVR